MGSILLKSVQIIVQYTIVFAILLAFLPGLPPNIHFESYTYQLDPETKITPSVDLQTLNKVNALDKAEVVLKGQVLGAESLAVLPEGDGFYAGLENGKIVRYREGAISVVADVGQVSNTVWGRKGVYGRPLGMRVERSGELLVAHTDQGIIRVDPNTGKFQRLFDFNTTIQGQVPSYVDDLDVSQNGRIYWSDIAASYDMFNLLEGMLGSGPTGRLIMYDPTTKKNTVLINGIHLATGVQLSENEEFVLVSETLRSRILRYYLKGPKAGQQDIFMDGVPGLPHNPRPNGKGGYYIPLMFPRQYAIDTLARYPIFPKMILRLQRLLIGVVSIVRGFVPENCHLGEPLQFIANFLSLDKILGVFGGPSRILEVDADGKVLRVLEHSQNKITVAAQVTLDKYYAYIGRFAGDHIFRIKIVDLGGDFS